MDFNETQAQRWLRNAREKYLEKNPMSMEEINRIISFDSDNDCGTKDYSKWQRGYFDKMSPDEFMEKAVRFEAEHPYSGQGKVLD